MSDLTLDASIRVWVFLPIILIVFFVGIVRYYLNILLSSQAVSLQHVKNNHALIRARLLRENGDYLQKSAFLMRKHYFNNSETGCLIRKARTSMAAANDPIIMLDAFKRNVSHAIPMLLIGEFINWFFSGYVTTKVPFPLTLLFKRMLQRGLQVSQLNAMWISSVSWYFLCVFGLQSVYNLILSTNSNISGDRTRKPQDDTSFDYQTLFKMEWEALQIKDHKWLLGERAVKLYA